MLDMHTQTRRDVLEERLTRGVEILFEMEQRGDTGDEYGRWFAIWSDLLREYEQLLAN